MNPKASYFTAGDALCRYWQMELAEEDQHLTMQLLVTPFAFM